MGKNKIIKVVVLVLLAVLTIILFLKFNHKIMHLKMWHVKKFILGYGNLSVFVIFFIYFIKPLIIFFPIFMVSMVVGNIYGPFNAAIINLIGAFLSATVAFFISRFLGKDFVDNILKGKALKIDHDIEKHGFKIIMLMRLSFVFPYDILSYTAGLTKMKYKDFILGTIIGIFPEVISYAFVGHNMGKPFSIKFLLSIFSIIIMALIFSLLLKKAKKNI